MQTPFFNAVSAERDYQDKKWGTQRHDFPTWLAILTEEVGEVSQEILNTRFNCTDQFEYNEILINLRAELVQVAAVSGAIYEHINEILETHK